jgi:hypothetical protein
VSIQNLNEQNSCLQNTLATRDLLMFWMTNKKKLRAWGKEQREEISVYLIDEDEDEEDTEAEDTEAKETGAE